MSGFQNNSARVYPIKLELGMLDHKNNTFWNTVFQISVDVPLNSVLLLLLVNFVNGFRLELMYISLIVSIRSSLTHHHGFQLLEQLPYFIKITFFICTNRISLLNLRFRQVSNHCKRVLEATKVAYANKTKQSITSQKRDSQSFGEFPIVFSAKVNLLYLLCSTIWRCFLLHLIKQNCLLKTFLRSLILKTQVSLYLLSLRELIWNRKIFL